MCMCVCTVFRFVTVPYVRDVSFTNRLNQTGQTMERFTHTYTYVHLHPLYIVHGVVLMCRNAACMDATAYMRPWLWNQWHGNKKPDAAHTQTSCALTRVPQKAGQACACACVRISVIVIVRLVVKLVFSHTRACRVGRSTRQHSCVLWMVNGRHRRKQTHGTGNESCVQKYQSMVVL